MAHKLEGKGTECKLWNTHSGVWGLPWVTKTSNEAWDFAAYEQSLKRNNMPRLSMRPLCSWYLLPILNSLYRVTFKVKSKFLSYVLQAAGSLTLGYLSSDNCPSDLGVASATCQSYWDWGFWVSDLHQVSGKEKFSYLELRHQVRIKRVSMPRMFKHKILS